MPLALGVLAVCSEKTSNRSFSDSALRVGRNEWKCRIGTMVSAAAERGETTWWCRYILPEGGILMDPFAGGGTILAAGWTAERRG
jgi:hypothetical protein